MSKLRHLAPELLLIGLTLALSLIDLERVPPVWWDEGWTMSVARNWVEQGHFGRMLMGESASSGLSASFPNVAAIALSFKWLGIGIWQARLVGVVLSWGALALMYYLATRLYSRSIAIGAWSILLFMSASAEINPILSARQVLADIPAVFYLLAGYVCFWQARRRTWLWMSFAVFFWSIALNVKAQPLPFWAASLFIPFVLAVAQRQWGTAVVLGLAMPATYALYRAWPEFWFRVLVSYSIPSEPLSGLYEITAFVPVLRLRLQALAIAAQYALLTLLGLAYAGGHYLYEWYSRLSKRTAAPQRTRAARLGFWSLDMRDRSAVVRLMLLILAGSWSAWYLLLSNSGSRYLASPNFIGALFGAVLLFDLTEGYRWGLMERRALAVFKLQPFAWKNLRAVLVFILLALAILPTMATYLVSWLGASGAAYEVADFLNEQAASASRIESYESELFFLLDRRYHYPPDQVHLDLLRRYLLGSDRSIDYDPLIADPDYLVVGPINREWQVYDRILSAGDFQLLKDYGRYQLYERVR